MSKAYLCIGSNVAEASCMIYQAVGLLRDENAILLEATPIYQVSAPYYNFVGLFEIEFDYEELVALTKNIETTMGRTPEMKQTGEVPIDIDVVIFDGEVKRQRDYEAPYFVKGYELLNDVG